MSAGTVSEDPEPKVHVIGSNGSFAATLDSKSNMFVIKSGQGRMHLMMSRQRLISFSYTPTSFGGIRFYHKTFGTVMRRGLPWGGIKSRP